MGKCKYCGQSAGFLSRSHKECEEKHSNGIKGLTGMLEKYFQGAITAAKMGQNITQNRASYFLSDDDIASIAANALGKYSSSLRRPAPANTLVIISDFLQNIGISVAKLNSTGVVDALGKKLMQWYLVDFFANGTTMQQANNNAMSVMNVIPLNSTQRDEVYMTVLNKAASNFMKNGFMTDSEEQLINTYTNYLGLSISDLPSSFANTDLEKISQAMVLKDLEKGILPQKKTSVPVLLSRGESPLWVYHNVIMNQEKIQREYRGRSGGFSFRVCKGVTYRTGQFKGRPVETSYMDRIGNGSLVVTNKNLYFHCDTSSVKIPIAKLVGVTPYSDGIELHKDEAKPKRIVFQGFDSWFIMNVLSIVSDN